MKKLIYILGFISVGLVFAKDSPSDCAKIESNASRLACYDKFNCCLGNYAVWS